LGVRVKNLEKLISRVPGNSRRRLGKRPTKKARRREGRRQELKKKRKGVRGRNCAPPNGGGTPEGASVNRKRRTGAGEKNNDQKTKRMDP